MDEYRFCRSVPSSDAASESTSEEGLVPDMFDSRFVSRSDKAKRIIRVRHGTRRREDNSRRVSDCLRSVGETRKAGASESGGTHKHPQPRAATCNIHLTLPHGQYQV